MTHLVLVASTAALQICLLRRLRFGWPIVAIVLAGLLVEASYLGYTPITTRNYDGPSQVFYIDYLTQHLRLPPVDILCTTCGHPPLYYALAALWSKVVLAGGWLPRELGLQWLSLLLSSGFVVFALLLLRSFIERPATLHLAAALVVFWPSSILNSVRVHNDALASVLMLAALYFIARWDRQGGPRDFRWALLTCALALLTKATGYAVAATLLLVAGLRLRSQGWRRDDIGQVVLATLVLVGAALLPLPLRGSTAPASLCQRVLGGACEVPAAAFVGNRPIDYLTFDVRGFLRDTSSMSAPPRQDSFWTGLAKSSLFGVMPLGRDFEGRLYARLAVLLGVLLLAMAAVGVVGLPWSGPVSWPDVRAIVIASAAMLLFLLAFRIALPTPFHQDFRHIFPVLVPLGLLYGKSVERIGRWSGVLSKAGIALALMMVGASVVFFVRIP
jgi:hypothetical protein